jgi:hypothetical protein
MEESSEVVRTLIVGRDVARGKILGLYGSTVDPWMLGKSQKRCLMVVK